MRADSAVGIALERTRVALGRPHARRLNLSARSVTDAAFVGLQYQNSGADGQTGSSEYTGKDRILGRVLRFYLD